MNSPHVETLRYSVPEGQDPAAVVAALRLEGLEATRDSEATSQDVLVTCPSGADAERERARQAITGARNNLADTDDAGAPANAGGVRFADE